MSYNKQALPHYMKAAGKISVVAAFTGLAVFMFAFMVDVGQQEFQRVSAQTATTSLTVLNTPPVFTILPTEVIPSSTTTPTNSGDDVRWEAVGTDSNGAPYFLLVCSTGDTPVSTGAADEFSLGTVPPACNPSGVQWAVSTSTVSGEVAFAATTTSEAAGSLFLEENAWFAWVCDDDPSQPACNAVPSQGIDGAGASTSSPFNMNRRPVLTSVANDGPTDPSSLITFFSTSSDPDIEGGDDTIRLVVCQTNTDYNTVTNQCDANALASSSLTFNDDANATTTTPAIIRDGSYPAFAYLVDEHGHEAVANPIQADFIINNVSPTVLGGDIVLNGASDLTLTVPGDETPGFTLDFTISDANSCTNAAAGAGAGGEITGFEVAVFRSGTYSTSTDCNPQSADYNANYCYTHVSGTATSTWNLDCTPDVASCTGATDDTQVFNCTFPLWFLADPTDAAATTPITFANDIWVAAVAGADDNFATSSLVAGTIGQEVISATFIDLITAEIPYGELAPGDNTGTLRATTTVLNIGNTGLDQAVDGSAMCPPFVSDSSDCSLNATSTIFTSNQQFSSTSLAYNSPLAVTLPTTTVATPAEVELDILKTTATSTFAEGQTFWGIEVPAAITVAGSYTGLNTFFGITAEAEDWE